MSDGKKLVRLCYISSSIFRHDIEIIGKPVFSFLGLTLLKDCAYWRTWPAGIELVGFKIVSTSRLGNYD